MKVLIVNNMAPFVWGGAEELAANLALNITQHGHAAEVLRIPFQWEPAEKIPSQMLMVRALELWNVDHVIALKFPAYLIRHPHKTLWLLHQYRQAYDLFDVGQTNLPVGNEGDELRNMIANADSESFRECRKIFTNSSVTKARLAKYNGYEAEVLLPPINDQALFCGGESQGYIFAGGRINNMKRQHLLVEAMRFTSHGIKLIVAGPPDGPQDADRLSLLVEKYNLSDRVHLDMRFLERAKLAQYVNHSMACAYLPFDEDSLGYVSMEAATASKATISAFDSGGILELVRQGETGWISDPSPRAVAEVISEVFSNPDRARQMGIAASQYWQEMGINWPKTIERLLN